MTESENRNHFLQDRNIVAFEHLMIPPGLGKMLSAHIANPLDQGIAAAVSDGLGTFFRTKIEKYGRPGVSRHVKLVYLFLTEGMAGGVSGRLFGVEQESILERHFADGAGAAGTPRMELVGIRELRPILAAAEARMGGDARLADFLLREDGHGGYDTPKIAAALVQLARRDYEMQEVFVRFDDDVDPTEGGLLAIKEKWFELTRDPANPVFCFSWNYESVRLADIVSTASSRDNYQRLFRYFVNTFSIRTTFLASPQFRCRPDPEKPGALLPDRDPKSPCRLNLVHAKYLTELFGLGRWGSGLRDPISGAGMAFSAETLVTLPPWCNADALITWIDDFIKQQLIAKRYGQTYCVDTGLLSSAEAPGFEQDRNDPDTYSVADALWSCNTYLDRLFMGCLLSFAVDPARYGARETGFAAVLGEKDFLGARQIWEGGIEGRLRAAAREHGCRILLDWHLLFCEQPEDAAPENAGTGNTRGYLTGSGEAIPPPPTGFVPAPADTFFNSWVLLRLRQIQDRERPFDPLDQVFKVLNRYLDLKYRFWPHVVEQIDKLKDHFHRTCHARGPVPGMAAPTAAAVPQGTAWLFRGLDEIHPPAPRAVQRVSRAAFAFITRPPGGAPDSLEWFLQWNRNWHFMNFISGHIEEGESPLLCIMREVHEELFAELDGDQVSRLAAALGNATQFDAAVSEWKDPWIAGARLSRIPGMPGDYPPFVEFSEAHRKWTRYEFYLFEVTLTEEGRNALAHPDPFATPPRAAGSGAAPEAPGEWVTREEAAGGWTALGRPISPTVTRLFRDLDNAAR